MTRADHHTPAAETTPTTVVRAQLSATERLVEVAQELSVARDLDAIMEVVRLAARELTSADGATFVLRDADISDVIASTLEDHGYSVIVAANGQEALDKLRQATRSPHLIVLDLMMPVMDGWQFRAAQKSHPALADVPVVLLSAHVDVRSAASEMAAVAWLKKPVDLTALIKVVEASYDRGNGDGT